MFSHEFSSDQRNNGHKADRLNKDETKVGQVDTAILQRCDHSEDEHGENIVNHRCPENDPAFQAVQNLHVPQDLGGNSGRGCHERRRNKEGFLCRKAFAERPRGPHDKWENDAGNSHQPRDFPYFAKVLDASFESY